MAAKTTGKIKFDVNTGTGTLEFPEGLTTGREKKSTNPVENDNNKKEASSDPEWANDLLDSLKSFTSLADVFKGQLPTFFKDLGGDFIAEKLNPILGGIFGDADGKGNKENINNRNKTRLKTIDPGTAAGFILIYNRLDDIYNAIVGKNDKKGDDKEKGGFAKKMGNFFKGLSGLGANILAIAGALVLFVGAVALAKTAGITITDVLLIAGSFTLFATLMVTIGIFLKKKEGDIKSLALGMMGISFALILFAGALWIGNKVITENATTVWILPAVMAAFIFGISFLKTPLTGAAPAIAALALFALALSVSLFAFGFALGVLEEKVTVKSMIAAGTFFVLVGALCLGALAIAPAVIAAAAPVAALALFAIALSASLLLFSLALDALNGINLIKAAASLVLFKQFLGMLGMLGIELLVVGALMAAGAVGAALITVSLAVYLVCFTAMSGLVFIMNKVTPILGKLDIKPIMIFFAKTLAVIASSMLVGALALAAFTLGAKPLIVGLLAMFTVVNLVFTIARRLGKISNQLGFLQGASDVISSAVTILGDLSKVLIQSFKENNFDTKSLKALTKRNSPLRYIERVVNMIYKVVKRLVKLADGREISNNMATILNVISNDFFPALFTIMSFIVNKSENMSKSAIKNIKKITKNLSPIIDTIMKIPNLIKELNNKDLDNVDDKSIRTKLNSLVGLLNDIIGDVKDKLELTSKSTFKSFGKSLKQISNAFTSLKESLFGENGVFNIINSSDVGNVKEKISTLISALDEKDGLQLLINKLAEMKDGVTAVSAMKGDFKNLPKTIESAINALISVTEKMNGKKATEMNTSLLSTIDTVLKPFFDYLGTIPNAVNRFVSGINVLSNADIGGAIENVSGLTELNAINFDPAVHSIRQLTKSIHELGNEIQRMSAKTFMSDMLEGLTNTINAASDKLASLNNVDNLGSKFTFKNKREEIAESLGEEDPVQQNLEQIVDYLKYFKEMGIKQQGSAPIMSPAVAQVPQYGVDKELNSYFPS